MIDKGKFLTVELLDEDEAKLAFEIQGLLKRIADVGWSVFLTGGAVSVISVLVAAAVDGASGSGYRMAFFAALGSPNPEFAGLSLVVLLGAVGGALWWMLYGRRKRRLLESELSRVTADPRAPQVFEKRGRIYAANLRLTREIGAANDFFKPQLGVAPYVRKYLGSLAQKA